MSYNNLDITNVVDVQVAQPPAGLSNYHVNNLLILTKDVPVNVAITQTSPGVYLDPISVGVDFGNTSETYKIANAIFEQEPNILDGDGSLIIFPMGSGDTLDAAFALAVPLMFFGGVIWAGYSPDPTEITDLVNAAQAARRLVGVSSSQLTDLDGGSLFANIAALNTHCARMFIYSVGAVESRIAMGAYMSRLMSTNFAQSASTSTMQMKDLIGIAPDPLISQSVLTSAATLGVDCYATIAGLPKVFSSGANDFSDNVYNQNAFVFDLEVALFNALATTSNKIPQTEPGIAILKDAIKLICEKYVTNGFIAPGSWNSSTTIGIPAVMRRNILDVGYYIFSEPVNKQSQADRAERKAPPLSVAIKYAGAVHSVNCVVNVNP